nr:cation/calcium exchanger 4-like [Tanacetum cinerariifolium]
MELILAKCECCGLTEECTFEYIYKIRERYHGKWICGLCGEAIKDEIVRGEKLISTKEAMARLINFCKESKTSNKMTEPTIHLIAAMRQIMLRSLDSPRALRLVLDVKFSTQLRYEIEYKDEYVQYTLEYGTNVCKKMRFTLERVEGLTINLSSSIADIISCPANESALGAVLLVFWLVALFYLLGNTAADYFCLSLRKMSGLLRLSPAVAGVSLLPLGNGAPDVFASVVSFVGNGNGEVGLNSVLGGAVFVTCVVVGVVAICVGDQGVRIDKKAFLRDVGFFMFTLVFLFLMLFVGRVSFVVAVMFVSIYVVYAVFVAANEIVEKHVHRLKMDIPLRVGNIFSKEEDSVQTSLLDVETEDDGSRNSNVLPEWMWASNVAIYSNQMKLQEHERHLWGWQDDGIEVDPPWSSFWKATRWSTARLTIHDFCNLGILNSKRSRFSIRETLVDGEWIVDPLVVKSRFVVGIPIDSSLTFSHLFFTDDDIFVAKSDSFNISTIFNVLKCFHLASGLDINFHKSKLMGIETRLEEVDASAKTMGCLIFTTFFVYLGVKVGGAMYRKKSWDDLVAKVSSRLSNWKLKTLSIGGRVTLIKSILTSIPLYHMSIFKVPPGVLKLLESIRKKPFNRVDGSKRKMAWISWNKVLLSKKYSGLRVSSIYALNRAFLFKWVWRFFSPSSCLWTRFITAIYGEDGALNSSSSLSKRSPWLDIIREDVSVIRNENGQSTKEIPVVVNAKVMNNSQDVYKEASCDNVGLNVVKKGGYTFTWSHPSRSKMSKLDRFLVSEGIFSIFPSITAVCLNRHLSDHRLIILDLKVRIRAWIKDKRLSVSGEKDSIKKESSDIDKLLDGGDVFDSNLLRRSELHRNLYNINQTESKEYLQKSKIKWAIEGDENSKCFHGLINKKRSQLAIRGVFVDGICKRLSDVQASDSERRVSRDEIRLAVWNCGENKSPVDFAKAYDSVRWDYLLDVLEASGFGNIWCKWIRGTFSSVKASVLVNGSPTIEFPFHCGLKQGDPLSPYLFILITESLNMSFTRAIDECVFKGVHLHGSTFISHLFYAGDVMFIGEWSDDNLKGVMVGECMSRHNAWASTVDKLRSRLSKWKVKTLFIGGRLTLLKAVLGASPLYNKSIFKVPKGILNSMEAIRNGSLWFRVIKALYGTSIDSHPVNLSSIWCSIIRELHLLVGKGFHFLDRCKKRIGNGRDTCFWYDNWLGDKPLKDLFPRLFALELNKEVTVADKGQGVVSSSFRRPVRAGSEYQHLTDLNLLME